MEEDATNLSCIISRLSKLPMMLGLTLFIIIIIGFTSYLILYLVYLKKYAI